MSGNFSDVDGYLSSLAPAVRERTEQVRAAMLAAVGDGVGEKISYNIPLVTLNGTGVLFYAGWAKHVAIYPTPQGTPWEDELSALRTGKDSLQLKHSRELPLDLVSRITRWQAERVR